MIPLLTMLIAGLAPMPVQDTGTELIAIEKADNFHRNVILAAKKRVKAGEMKRSELFKLRSRMLLPLFRAEVKNLALTQMKLSGADNLPTDAEGNIDETAIDWDGLIGFLERLIPIILQLIQIFGGGV